VSRRGGRRPRDWGSWMDRIDWVIAVRGASLGFTILVINGFLQLLVQRVNAVAGLI